MSGHGRTVDSRQSGGLRWFFGVVARRQTYYNLAYLLLAFPLGLTYFVFLVAGFSLSLTLTVILIGIPMVVLVLSVTTHLAAVERSLADSLLDVDVPAAEPEETDGIVDWLKTMLLDVGTWKGLVYLFSKFVTGLVSFIVSVVFGAVVFAFVSAPFHYRDPTTGVHLSGTSSVGIDYQHDVWNVGIEVPLQLSGELISTYADTLVGALAFSVIGLLLAVVLLHVLNGIAWLYGKYTELLLRDTRAHSPN
ncbi:sensor domain-containing protein [Halostella sp. PRR32]|uniref:sensor domain-containing protein n=1 Tax=Halostella sp. PRR32 TaxID=3098147 RepID=UPI002B1D2F71|nr:sensor domain-containing protein [Halostella sp. PRR32]